MLLVILSGEGPGNHHLTVQQPWIIWLYFDAVDLLVYLAWEPKKNTPPPLHLTTIHKEVNCTQIT